MFLSCFSFDYSSARYLDIFCLMVLNVIRLLFLVLCLREFILFLDLMSSVDW